MKLTELTRSDIYRDGGSLDGAWVTSDKTEWTICLKVRSIKHAPNLFEDRAFTLFECKLNERSSHEPVKNRSVDHQRIMALIENWMIEKNLSLDNLKNGPFPRASEFIKALRKGNY